MSDLRTAAQRMLAAVEDSGHKADVTAAADDLRAALAQQEEPVWMHPWPPVRAQQAEPVQEPVAWLYEAGADRTLHWHKPPLCGTPLYTAPPQRKPLTEEEINALELPPSGTATVRDLVRLIERAHGIGEAK